MLRGEMITFSPSPEFSSTLLKISNANEFSDSIRLTWSRLRSIGTGSVGRLSSVLLHETKKRINIKKMAADVIGFRVFMIINS